MQYDPTAPGRPELLNGPAAGDTGDTGDTGDAGDTRDGRAGFLDPDHVDLADEIDHADLAEAIDGAARAGIELAGAELPDHVHEEEPPIEYRDQGTTATTRPARRLRRGLPQPPPPPVPVPRPDPGPAPF